MALGMLRRSALFRSFPPYSVPFRVIPCLSASLRSELPSGPWTSSGGNNQSQRSKYQVIPNGLFRHRRCKDRNQVPEPLWTTITQGVQNSPLPIGQIMLDSVGRHIAFHQKPHDNAPSALLELRARMARCSSSRRRLPSHSKDLREHVVKHLASQLRHRLFLLQFPHFVTELIHNLRAHFLHPSERFQ
jgi:hypothetical protein